MKQSGIKPLSAAKLTTGFVTAAIVSLAALLQPASLTPALAQNYPDYDQAAYQQQPDPNAPPAASYSQEQIDQLVAPIALYPDQLLGQILMASTYPLEIVEAYRWQQANPGLTGDQLADALAQQPWDPSVKAITAFPQVLASMNNSIEWTEQLGDAFLAQQAAVMDSVQRLRHDAEAAGHLQSTPQQTVETQGPEILIQPANPEYVYVPAYNPEVVYGTWPYPDYQPYGFAGYAGYGAVLGFGVGVAVLASYWGWDHWDWHNHHILIDNSRYARINGGRPPIHPGAWQFDPSHRHGVPFHGNAPINVARGNAGRGNFVNRGGERLAPAQGNFAAAAAHNNFRGYDGNIHPAVAPNIQRPTYNRPQTPNASQNRAQSTPGRYAGFNRPVTPPNTAVARPNSLPQPRVAAQPAVSHPVFSPSAHAAAPAPMQPRPEANHNAPMFESFARGPDVRAEAARGAASRASTPAVAHAPVQHSAPQGGFHGGAPNNNGGDHQERR